MQAEKQNAVQLIQVEPTTRCNLACPFCTGRSMQQGDLAPQIFSGLLDLFPSVTDIHLQGEGEPLLHPQFFTFLKQAGQHNISVSTITNGSLLTPAYCERLVAGGINRLNVSLEAADSLLFKELRGFALEKLSRGLTTLRELCLVKKVSFPVIGLSVTVLRKTIAQIPAIVDFYRGHKLRGGIHFQTLQQNPFYMAGYDQEMRSQVLGDSEIRQLYRQYMFNPKLALVYLGKSHFKGFHEKLYPLQLFGLKRCPWLERGLFINFKGMAMPCSIVKDAENFAYGRIGQLSPAEIIHKRAELQQILQEGTIPPTCQGCRLAFLLTRKSKLKTS